MAPVDGKSCSMRRMRMIVGTIFLFHCVFFFLFIFSPASRRPVKSNRPRSYWLDNSTVAVQTERISYEFCVAYNVTKAHGRFRDDGLEPISLAIHTTSHYVYDVEEQCSTRSWNGPVSVALFVDRFSSNAVDYLYDLHRCAPKMNLHVVYRLSAFQKKCEPIFVNVSNMPCSNFTREFRGKTVGKIINSFGIYPINVMRNVARRGAMSNIHVIADVEMKFSLGFALNMKKLANVYINGQEKNVIVIRRFEVDSSKNVPKDHTELFNMIKSREAFEFHHKFFPLGHTIEGLWHWFRVSRNYTDPVAWEIPYKGSSWEAQVIQHRNDPYSADYMPTRIRDQQALIYELCRANYTFLLASQVFNVHRGVKIAETNINTAVVNHQMKIRSRAFQTYKHQIDTKYPETHRRCGLFVM
ncbi:unnamed protein product [Caenorhabditis auriculariae]|uniref:Uncharacterized protein n=1 Tax=Caenorhabditis auriculariae TaxID=2777116 RepID=A0A8S1HIA8_9PELO|nr:unnamed protein product [Caenorhabditis auriculariae]